MTSLEPISLPANDWSTFITDHTTAALTTAREAVARLKDGTARSAIDTLTLWNEGEIATTNIFGMTELFAQVHPDPAVRELMEKAQQEVSAFVTEAGQDAELHAVFAAVDPAELDADSSRLLEKLLLDFRRSGVDRDDATRARLTAIVERITAIEQEYGRNVRDDVRSIRIAPELLAGMPDDYIAAHPAGEDGLVEITTDYPDVRPFLVFAHDRDSRHAISRAFNSRGWPANDALLHELFDLRHEQAQLLGYNSWPDFDTEVKMIDDGDAIAAFIDRITELSAGAAHTDVEALLARARQDDPSIEKIVAGDTEYYSELVRREQYDVDAQAVRRYFDFSRVRDGVLAVTGRLFDLSYEPVTDAATWSADVSTYDVFQGGERIGRIHLDLHPREGKYKHAAQFDLVRGVSGVQLPEGVLVCNFSRGLMDHDQVTTFFHEFGHLMHHVLGGKQRWIRFSGVATEWDFVEAPSQMLEEWAWDASVLRTFAIDADGSPIPADLVERMTRADAFGRGRYVRTQMFYAAVSYYLHLERPADHDAAVAELSQKYSVIERLPGTHMQTSFGHLTGYSSGYYTYMWSLVIAKDMFSAFDPADLFDPSIAARYRDEVLARGGSDDAANLVANFLGRPSSFDAFAKFLAG